MAALPAVAAIPVLNSTQRGALLRDILQVAQADYLHVLRGIAAQEVNGQKQLGNPPSGMVVDGTRNKGIAQATRSVVVWFADRKALAAAIIAARDALVSNGRRVTGHTLSGLQFYYSVGRGGAIAQGDPKSIAQSVSNPAALDLYVALPQPHVRKWQWFGKSGGRLKRRTRNKALTRYAAATKTKAMMVSRSVFEVAAKQVQARFRSLDVLNVYLSVSNLNIAGRTAVDRIPAIKVHMKVRGRGR